MAVNNKQAEPTNTVLYGAVNKTQYEEWQDKYYGQVCVLTVIHPRTKETLGCYLKPMGMNDTSIAMTFQSNQQLVEGGRIIVENCWLGGDTLLKNPSNDVFDEQAAVAAALAAWKNFPKFQSKAQKTE